MITLDNTIQTREDFIDAIGTLPNGRYFVVASVTDDENDDAYVTATVTDDEVTVSEEDWHSLEYCDSWRISRVVTAYQLDVGIRYLVTKHYDHRNDSGYVVVTPESEVEWI